MKRNAQWHKRNPMACASSSSGFVFFRWKFGEFRDWGEERNVVRGGEG